MHSLPTQVVKNSLDLEHHQQWPTLLYKKKHFYSQQSHLHSS